MPDDVLPAQSPAWIMQTNIPFPTKLETDGSAVSNGKNSNGYGTTTK